MGLIDLKIQKTKTPKSIYRWIEVEKNLSFNEFTLLVKEKLQIKKKILSFEYYETQEDMDLGIRTKITNDEQIEHCLSTISPETKIILNLSDESEIIERDTKANNNEMDEKNMNILMDRFPTMHKADLFQIYLNLGRNVNSVLNHFASGVVISNKSEEETIIENAFSQIIKEKEDIYLILDTNIYAGTQIERLRKILEHPRIILVVPYIIFQELDDFKDTRSRDSEGEIKRYVGRNAFKLFEDFYSKVKIGKQSELKIWDISTKIKKDDYFMFSVKYYEELKTKKVVVVSKDKGVSLRIKSQCPDAYMCDNLLDVYKFIIENK